MNRFNRWIYFPLLFVAIYLVSYGITGQIGTLEGLLGYALLGLAVGMITLGFSDYSARKRSKRSSPEIFEVRQNRSVTVMRGIDEALELCREAVLSLGNVSLKSVDEKNKIVVARSHMNWKSFGSIGTMELRKIDDRLTEINISTRPIPRTALVDSGEGWELAERLIAYLRRFDKEVDAKILADGATILSDATVRPIASRVPKIGGGKPGRTAFDRD